MTWFVHTSQRLDSGGQGDVFLGRRSDTGEQVVVKVLRDAHIAKNRKSFEREIKLLNQGLRGVMPVLGFNLNTPTPFYVMPYFAGGSLEKWVGRLTAAQVRGVGLQLASIVGDIHKTGFIHGDIKPANLLPVQGGGLIVADPMGNGYGCTLCFSENVGGTPGYCPPEMGRGGTISAAGDVYSFGATLFHLFTGQRPSQHPPLEPSLIGQINDSLIREVIANCCRPASNERPTMERVRVALRDAESRVVDLNPTPWQQAIAAGLFIGGALLVGHLISAEV